MKKDAPVGEMIKRFIKFRNKSIQETADAMGINYKAFSAQLINESLSAQTLFKLSSYLDIDLNWMAAALGYFGPVSPLEKEFIPRMQQEFRDQEYDFVIKRLDALIEENPNSTADTRRELLKEFRDNTFYLLDVLVPSEYDFYTITDRKKTRVYVDSHKQQPGRREVLSQRNKFSNLTDENTALDIVIEDRKDKK